MDEYSAYVREFRQLVLEKYQQQHGNLNLSSTTHMKSLLKQIFHEIDLNHDGVITSHELRQFILALEIELTPKNNQTLSFSEILIHQIDIDNNGKISYNELMEFLWPKELSKREIGAVINKIRLALMSSIKWKYKKLKEIDDITLIEAFAKLTGAPLLRGNLVEVRSLRKAFSKIHNPTLGNMTKYEVDILVTSLDTNCDGVVSSREFRKWLLRVEDEIDFPPSIMEEIEALQNLSVREFEAPMKSLESVPPGTVEADLPLEEPLVPAVETEVPLELVEVESTKEEEFVETEPIATIQESLPTENALLESSNFEDTKTSDASPATFVPTAPAVPIVNKRSEPTLISTVSPLNTSLPTLSNTSLNQRRNKTNQDHDQKMNISKNSAVSPPPISTEVPNEQRGGTCLRWMAFFGIGVLVIYAVYRGDLWLPKPYKSLLK